MFFLDRNFMCGLVCTVKPLKTFWKLLKTKKLLKSKNLRIFQKNPEFSSPAYTAPER